MNPLRLSWLWLTLGLGLVGAVWFLSLTPRPLPTGDHGADKFGHLLAYAAQMGWFVWLVRTPLRAPVGLYFVLQGVLLEGLQGLVGYRSAEAADMLANAAGVLLGWALAQASGNLPGSLERRWFAAAAQGPGGAVEGAPADPLNPIGERQ